MSLIRAGEYAVRCVYFLARQGEGVVTKRQQISHTMSIPDQFLGKIASNYRKQDSLRFCKAQKEIMLKKQFDKSQPEGYLIMSICPK
jgi:hypothetical protein